MSEQSSFDAGQFRLSTGGFYYTLLTRIGFLKEGEYCIKRRILLLLAVTLLPLLLLSGFEGTLFPGQTGIPFLTDSSMIPKYLVGVPLLVVAGPAIDARLSELLGALPRFGFFDDKGLEEFGTSVDRILEVKDSYLADIVITVIGITTMLFLVGNPLVFELYEGSSGWASTPGPEGAELTLTGYWAVSVSATIVLVLMLRWFWRYLLWLAFMFRLSRQKFKLQASHPDLSGGLGVFANAQSIFVVIFLALGVFISATMSAEMRLSLMTLSELQGFIFGFIAVSLILMVLPLFFFAPLLIKTKRSGRVKYGLLGSKLSAAFEEKRLRTDEKEWGPKLLESGDSSAVCDYKDVYGAVRDIRVVPVNLKDLIATGVLLVVPFVPLVLIGVPVKELFNRLLQVLL